VARQRSSSPADLRERFLSVQSSTRELPRSRFIRVHSSVGQRKAEIERHLPAGDVRHGTVPHNLSGFILIESEVDKRADEIARLRAALADDVSNLSSDWVGVPASSFCAWRKKATRSLVAAKPAPRTSGSFAVNTSW